ncbi:hypothetical protein, variant [Aphanomyces invadans]|uniref:Uncharacterized protein n=1 Tax=Aphanomyces invadans TaxID=157072 RepID=A0A024USQ3_9STRA|nr:hypothetical protein, variant [Aphanomyces invadans]ETW09551.1 hypothetical protein, variant [Aphanomyces invadans]|eukprot:XP_008860962.1 hypothetical protein, variant [Aphanomyces invadans]
MPTSNREEWAAKVKAAHAVCLRRGISSSDEYDLLALGLVSSIDVDDVVTLCKTGTVISTLLHLDENPMNMDEVSFARLSLALVKQCLDIARDRVDDVTQPIYDMVFNVCFPLLLQPTTARALANDTLQLLLHALELIPSTNTAWWETLRTKIVDEFARAVLSASQQHDATALADPTWLGYVVEFLFQHHVVSPSFIEHMTEFCTSIITSPDLTSFRQAILGSVVPQLIKFDAAIASSLSTYILRSWQQSTLQDSLLMLCELFPHGPDLHTASPFHAIVRVGLQHSETVVRKMALHLLRSALARGDPSLVHASWGTFIHAFEIVHFHHEQHLLEQVWSSIASLIELTTVMASSTDKHEACCLFTAPLQFDWFQGIVQRCWHHDNPVVRRITLVDFMAVAVSTWQKKATAMAIHPDVIPFVLTALFPALNDPFLFKHEKYQVRVTTIIFCSRFLQLATADGNNGMSLLTYLHAIQAAIFGDSTRGNSPDALLAMLSVFGDLEPLSCHLLDAEGLRVLRYIVHAHVLQSFPKIMKVLVPVLERILFAFTVPPESLPLDVLARYLLLFPVDHIHVHRKEFTSYLAPIQPMVQDALTSYFDATSAPTLSTAALTRLVLCSPLSTQEALAPMLSSTPLKAHVCQFYQQLHRELPTIGEKDAITALLPATYFAEGLALAFPSCSPNSTPAMHADDLPDQLAMAYVVTHMALYAMQTQGDCTAGHALNETLATLLASVDIVSQHEARFAIQCLELIATEAPFLMDSLSVFDPQVLVPHLLQLSPGKPANHNHPTRTTSTQQFVLAKYTVLSSVLSTCWALPPPLLQTLLDSVLEALPTAGNDPLVLQHMVHVIRVVLPYTVFNLPTDEDKQIHLDDVYSQVWAAYSDSRKPNSLTLAVIQCVFQPRLMPLVDTLKSWFRKWTKFGEGGRRPNVLYHVATTLCNLWRRCPKSAEPYVDEIVALLLYKEPTVDAKEQMVYLKADSAAVALKERYVRFVVLAFLEDAPVACHGLLEKLTIALLELQLKPEYQTPQMVNSEGFGRQLRSWQALCVLSRYIQPHTVDAIHDLFWHKSFLNHNLPQIRYFIELFAMRVAVAFPTSSFPHVQKLLGNVHLMPQLSASLLLVASVSLRLLPVDDTPQLHLDTLLLMVPWLNSTHGHTRTIVQFVALTLLPYFLSHEATASRVAFLQPTLRYLSTNKECKRMFRRQTDQMASFQPEKECTLAGLLGGTLNEFDEIVPVSIVEQIKESLSASFAQFLKEDRHHGGQYQSTVAGSLQLFPSVTSSQDDVALPTAAGTNDASVSHDQIVQRKIDPNATAFLDELLAQTQAETLRDQQVNARRQRHQPVRDESCQSR